MLNLIGKTLGKYRIIEEIGHEGMATVYKAYQPSLNHYVAVKVLAGQLAKDKTFRQRFDRGAQAVAQLSHPNIVPVYHKQCKGGGFCDEADRSSGPGCGQRVPFNQSGHHHRADV